MVNWVSTLVLSRRRGPAECASNSHGSHQSQQQSQALGILPFSGSICWDLDDCTAHHEPDGDTDQEAAEEHSRVHCFLHDLNEQPEALSAIGFNGRSQMTGLGFVWPDSGKRTL